MLTIARDVLLIAATMSTGLAAGLLFAFAHAIMPGLGRTDDRTFVGAFQAVDKAINNPWMGLTFIGAPVFTVLSAVLHVGENGQPALAWILASLALYGVTIGITLIVHVPLNNEIHRAGPPDQVADLAAVRRQFEARWRRWNIARTATSVAAFGVLCWTLLTHTPI